MPIPTHYQPPLQAVGQVRFRLDGPALPAYEAATPSGPVLLYWSPLVQDYLPIHDPERALLERVPA